MHVRLKRGNQTVFLRTNPSATFGLIKRQLSQIIGVAPENIQLFAADKQQVLEDAGTIGGFEIRKDGVLFWEQNQNHESKS